RRLLSTREDTDVVPGCLAESVAEESRVVGVVIDDEDAECHCRSDQVRASIDRSHGPYQIETVVRAAGSFLVDQPADRAGLDEDQSDKTDGIAVEGKVVERAAPYEVEHQLDGQHA